MLRDTRMSESILLTDDNFEREVSSSEIPILVDFWADWCGPCWIMNPILEEIAQDYRGKVKAGKLNVDKNPKATFQHGKKSIQTPIIFKNGKPIDKIIGAFPKSHIAKAIEGVPNKD